MRNSIKYILDRLLLLLIIIVGVSVAHVCGTVLLAIFQMTVGMDFMNWLLMTLAGG